MLEGIILAGGFGTRLRQVVSDVPKPMAPINGKPFLEILLIKLAQKGFSRIILSLGFMSDKIIKYFGDSLSNIELVYVVEKEPLGTGGAVRLAMDKCLQNHVFIFNGDTYLDLEVEAVEQLWQKTQSSIMIGREVEDTSRYGSLLVNNRKVEGFIEKGKSGRGLINAGCYVLQKDALNVFPLHLNFSLESDYFANVVKNSPINLFITNGDFIDIGIPEDYYKAQAMFSNIEDS